MKCDRLDDSYTGFLMLLSKEFWNDDEWHFAATVHGNRPCDSVEGIVKREAVRTSLQRPYEKQITTPLQLCKWAKCDLSKTMNFNYVTQDEYIANAEHLAHCFSQAIPISGTRNPKVTCPQSAEQKFLLNHSHMFLHQPVIK